MKIYFNRPTKREAWGGGSHFITCFHDFLLNNGHLERYPEPQIFITLGRSSLRIAEIDVEQKDRAEGKTTLDWSSAARLLYRFNVFVIGELIRGRRS